MARRHFIKACNDMVSSTGQPNVGGLNISEFSNSGIGLFPKEADSISRHPSVKVHNIEKGRQSRKVVSPPKPSNKPPIAVNVNAGVKWNSITQKDRNIFIDIDGDGMPPEELKDEEIKVIDTSHKVQRHISLVDLARPYVPRAPNNSAKVMQENREKKKPTKNDEPLQRIRDPLPKGISNAEQPYVLPKFTPSFREMISTSRSKKDNLVSLTETTPPSLQSWAVEWNSEPRHSISIAELQEDIMREKGQRYTPSDINKYNNFVDEEHLSFNDDRPEYNGEPKEASSQVEGTHNNFIKKPSPKSVYQYLNQGESIDTYIEPADYEEMLKEMEAESTAVEVGSKPSVDWLPEKYEGMKRFFKSPMIEKYSFRDTIREKNEYEDRSQKSSYQNKLPSHQSSADDEFSLDGDIQKFHHWFRNRMTRVDKSDENGKNTLLGVDGTGRNPFYATGNDAFTSDREVGLESETCGEGHPTRTHLKEKPGLKKMKIPELRGSGNLPPKSDDIDSLAEQYPFEKNSSFFHWLKQRGLVNVMMSRTNERHRPARCKENKAAKIEKVVKPETKFPWSTSYTGKYVTESFANNKERKESKKDFKPPGKKNFRGTNYREPKYSKTLITQKVSGLHYRGTIPLRKAAPPNSFQKKKSVHKNVKPRAINDKVEVKKTNFEQEKGLARKSIPENEAKRPYYGWAVGSELDHVKNMRYMENNHAAPQVMNRKKLFPSLYDQIRTSSMNYWESRYFKPKSMADDLSMKIKGVNRSDTAKLFGATGETKKKSGSLINVTPMSNIFYDSNFINISDDPVIPLSKSGVDDDESQIISQYAPQQIGEKLSTGNHTLKAKQTGALETLKGDSPIHLRFSRVLDPKPDDGLGSLKDSSDIDGDGQFSVRGLEENRNEVDEEWTQMISPQDFSLDNDGDLIHLLKQSKPELKPSLASTD